MSRDGTRCLIIQRELVSVISSTAAGFSMTQRLRCNPGSVATFPWLSTIANSFETYRFRRLRFHSIARCPTTTNGSIIMAPDYDAQDGTPLSEVVVSQMKGAVESSPWQDLTLTFDPSAMNRLYKAHVTMDDTRFANTTQDEKTVDVGQAFVFLDMDAAVKVSKLWVDYEVELFTPQPPNLAPVYDGGSIVIGVSAENPGLVAGANKMFSNTKISPLVKQSDTNPLFEVIDNSTTNSGNLVKMLRDYVGNVDFVYNAVGANALGADCPNLFVNGVAAPFTAGSPYAFLRSFVDATISSTQVAKSYGKLYEALPLKIGDIVGLNPAGITVANAVTGIDSMLRFGGNLHSW